MNNIINRYKDSIKGDIKFIGNTFGLSGKKDLQNKGTVSTSGAFITTDKSSKCSDFPYGTICNYIGSNSTAILNLPVNTEVVYAELIWSGTYKTPAVNVESLINNGIELSTPNEDNININPDSTTRFNKRATTDYEVYAYTRSADVTEYVKNGGNGEYKVGNVPAVYDYKFQTSGNYAYSGWNLAVVYKYIDETKPLKNITLNVLGEAILAKQDSLVVKIDNFVTPTFGGVKAKLLLAAGEGDYNFTGVHVYFGSDGNRNIGKELSGPNNLENFFFASQINGDDGKLVTTGTFGDKNHLVNNNNYIGTEAARQGFDITTLDVTNRIDNGKTSALLKVDTVGDSIFLCAVALSIDTNEDIQITIDKSVVLEGENLHYYLKIKNIGEIDATNIKITQDLPIGFIIDDTSLKLDGTSITGNLIDGILIDEIKAKKQRIIEFIGKANKVIDSLINKANSTFDYVIDNSDTPQTITSDSNEVLTDFIDVEVIKSSNHEYIRNNDELEYSLTITNFSTLSLDNVTITDLLSDKVTIQKISYNNNSITNDKLTSGINIGSINIGESKVIKYTVKVNNDSTGIISNTADIKYSYKDSLNNVYTKTQSTNTVNVNIETPNVEIIKSADKTVITSDGEVITYTLKITNNSNVIVKDYKLTDNYPSNMSYINNSTSINTETNLNKDPKNTITISVINPFETVTVVFSVSVDL